MIYERIQFIHLVHLIILALKKGFFNWGRGSRKTRILNLLENNVRKHV